MSSEYLNNKSFESIIIRFQNAKKQQIKFQILMEDINHQRQKANKKNSVAVPLVLGTQDLEKAGTDLTASQKILADAFYTLSKNIVRYAKFSNIDEDDAVQEGVLICFERVEKFDPSKGKAFNYMTTCILNHFRQLWRTAKNYNELKKKYSKIFALKNGMPIMQGKKKDRKKSH
jgi:hypothetical protein